jgi:DNA processing protein
MKEQIALIALSRLKGVNNILKKHIIDTVDSVAAFFEGKPAVFDNVAQMQAPSFKDWGKIEADIARLDKLGAGVVTIRDKEYPSLLRNIPDPPIVLYKKGNLGIGTNNLAVVGSRKATFEGINLAEKIGRTLSSTGITVVSGLARGIDAAAHRGALKEKGKTVAILGCGIDICYPPENRRLFNIIGEEGLLLTEYAPGEKPLSFHFPARNRIIAGLSKSVLVVEASGKSGSLITARLGLEYGREVMAVPGSIFREEYRGANALIKQGAKLVENINDILLTTFPDYKPEESKPVPLSPDEEKIFSCIDSEKVHIDVIIEKSGMKAKEVMAILTKLEMKDVILETPGTYYIRK